MFSIDPSTGAYTPVFPAAVPEGPSFAADSQAYDPVGKRWFFLAGGFTPPELYTVNLASNTVAHVPLASCCGRLQYDVVHGRLLELGVFPAQPGALSVFSIDPLTGAYTLVFPAAVTPVTLGPVADSQAYDPVGQRWFYLNGGFTPPELYTVNLSSNSVIHVPVASCCGRLAYQPDTIALAVPAAQFHVQILLIVILALIGCLVLSKNAFP